MPKITYPRPCPTCGKPFSKSQFKYHKEVCSGHRYHCTQCSLSFTLKSGLRRHIEQQHSPNPPYFRCPVPRCWKVFVSKHSRNLHVQTVHALVKPSFYCEYCGAKFAWKGNRQAHMRHAHDRICRGTSMNLLLHLRPLSHNPDCRDEWIFAKSRWIKPGEPRSCPCGKNNISSYYFLNNVKNNNRTVVGSTCIHSIDPNTGCVIAYFERLLTRSTRGTFRGVDREGLHWFQVDSDTKLVTGAFDDVKHYNPPVLKVEETCLVKVNYPWGTALTEGHEYLLWLKAKYKQKHLRFTVERRKYSHPESSSAAEKWCSLLQDHGGTFKSLLKDLSLTIQP